MEVVSLSACRQSSLLWHRTRDVPVLTVICKLTFSLTPGIAELAAEQDDVNEDDTFWNDDPARSLHSPSDVVPFKARPEVMLVGHAFSPRGEPARSIVARLTVGPIDKAIEVFCERMWTPDGLLAEGPRFVKMPLRYERAAGGGGTENPVGVADSPAEGATAQAALPNLQPPGILVSDRGDTIPCIGFGPLAPAWPTRRDKLGRHAGKFPRAGWPLEALPSGIDPSFFNAAPLDQQIEELHDRERIALQNLHPEHAQLVTALPGVHPRVFVQRDEESHEDLALHCDTLWIDTDRGTASLTWRAQIERPPRRGRVIVMTEGPGELLAWADVERVLQASLAVGLRSSTAPPPSATADDPKPPPMTRSHTVEMRADGSDPSIHTGPAFIAAAPQKPRATGTAEITPRGPLDTLLVAVEERPLATTAKKPKAKRAQTNGPVDPPTVTADPRVAESVPSAPGTFAIELLGFEGAFAARILTTWPVVASDEDEGDRIAAVLAGADRASIDDLDTAMANAIDERSRFVPPIVALGGELCVSFDEIETLKATIATMHPIARGDEHLGQALSAALELVNTPFLSASSGVVQRARRELHDRTVELLPDLDQEVERILVTQRHVRKRFAFGSPHVRALLFIDSSPSTPIPAYLSEPLALQLPLAPRIPVRIAATLHFKQDHDETHPHALRVVAIARALSVQRR